MDKLPEIVKQNKNATHGTTKMRPVNVQSETFIDLGIEINTKKPQI